MFKFFRKVRQKLLMGQNIKRYFLYAFGEIILVVIGILIAIQVNNLNEERKSRNIELDYLNRLLIDIKKDNDQWENTINLRKEQIAAIEAILNIMYSETPDSLVTIIQYIRPAFSWQGFNPNQITFREMMSSGNLNLIQNDSIKYNLLELDNSYSGMLNIENTFKIEHTNTMEAFRSISFREISLLFNSENTLSSDKIKAHTDKAILELQKLSSDNKFINNLIGLQYNYTNMLNHFNDLKIATKELIVMIQEEIDRRT